MVRMCACGGLFAVYTGMAQQLTPLANATVLALEFDPVQASAIQEVVCTMVGARLVLATSVAQAVTAMRQQTPDLILLPVLLSASEEATLREELRTLPNAGHVEMHLTPVLNMRDQIALLPPHAWRPWKSRPTLSSADDLHYFAEHLRWALERARERRLGVGGLGLTERRLFRRFTPGDVPGLKSVRIKGGPQVRLVDLSWGGALIESDVQIQPSADMLLELKGFNRKAFVRFTVLRSLESSSRVDAKDGRVRYLTACKFAEVFCLDELAIPAPDAAEKRRHLGAGVALMRLKPV